MAKSRVNMTNVNMTKVNGEAIIMSCVDNSCCDHEVFGTKKLSQNWLAPSPRQTLDPGPGQAPGSGILRKALIPASAGMTINEVSTILR